MGLVKKQLDLGCGSLPAFEQHGVEGYEHYGVDIIDQDIPNVKRADLALDDLPFTNDSFDLVTAHQVLEHIPKAVYLPVRRNCIIELFNEVYRVLKDGGLFRFDVPTAGSSQYHGDPTHVSEWLPDSINYLSGDYFGFHDDYGHTSKFVKNYIEFDPERDWFMKVELRAIKPAEPPYELTA